VLPKAHLHLHFTGSMRPGTVLDLAGRHGVRLPDVLADALADGRPVPLSATDERGWFRFQRLYDVARSCLRDPADVRRLVLEAAEDDVADGCGWLEIQVDPSGYAARFGGITSFLELVLDSVQAATSATGLPIGVVVAANRTRHELDARTLARLAAQYVGAGVVGFGLSNDERRGRTEDFAPAFRIAHRAGLAAVPHGGELLGADSVAATLDLLGAHRVGHGVRSVEDPRVLAEVVARGTTLEVCPWSNVSLGVYPAPPDVPLRALLSAGARVALGADDPLLFGHRLLDQYVLARQVHGLSDVELAGLARSSIEGSCAPSDVRLRLLGEVEQWLAAPVQNGGGSSVSSSGAGGSGS
jgi:adenosine deaminase